MDWITFIKWNGIVYTSYYGVNLLIDFLRTKGELSNNSSSIHYNLKDLGIEKPKVVKPSDFMQGSENPLTASKEKSKVEKNEQPNKISFGAPIERQAFPIDEYIRIATQSGNEIFQPTI